MLKVLDEERKNVLKVHDANQPFHSSTAPELYLDGPGILFNGERAVVTSFFICDFAKFIRKGMMDITEGKNIASVGYLMPIILDRETIMR